MGGGRHVFLNAMKGVCILCIEDEQTWKRRETKLY